MDCFNKCVRHIKPDGDVSTIAGTPGESGHKDGAAAEAQFNDPKGVTAHPDGGFVVADSSNNCIRHIKPDGEVI